MPSRNIRDLSFATFNLYNLHLPGAPIYTDRDGWSVAEFERKVAWSADLLHILAADVIGFQECWSREALARVFEQAGLADEYDLVARDCDPPAIQVALAVRRGLLRNEPRWIEAFPETCRFVDMKEARDAEETISLTIEKFSRPLLRVQIQPRGRSPKPPPVTIYVVHLKSKAPARLRSDNDSPVLAHHGEIARSVAAHVRRIAEAGALRSILDAEMTGNNDPLVVLGDLNDGTLSISTELVTGSPGYRIFAKIRKGERSDRGLYTVEKLQQLASFRHVYYTHIYEQQMESLDHILVSDCFYDNARNRLWSFAGMTVFNDHLAFETRVERVPFGVSDHGVVKATFDWNPAEDSGEES